MPDVAVPTAGDQETASTANRFSPFGPGADADATRQAQHIEANDAPLDVNMNACVCREQAGTFTIMGKNFEAGASRRNGLFDHAAALLAMIGLPK